MKTSLPEFLKQHLFEWKAQLETEQSALLQGVGTLRVDSRTIEPGDVYLALPLLDGSSNEAYLKEARERGAALVLTLPDDEGRKLWARWARHCHPHQPEKCVGVTGTNGKSSVVSFTRQLWAAAGVRSASLGTLGLVCASHEFDNSGEMRDKSIKSVESADSDAFGDMSDLPPVRLTSPDPMILHECLSGLARKGVQHVAMEVSSHGLDQHRVDEVEFVAAAFTNFNQDHLDYHGTMQNYFAAKSRLFTELLPSSGIAVLNRDDPCGQRLGQICHEKGQRVLWFGRENADLELRNVQAHPKGLALDIDILGKAVQIDVPLAGAFQAENILAALGLAIGAGMKPNQAIEGLATLRGVSGRMEFIGQTVAGGLVFVDYAHKPHALESVLKHARAHTVGTLGKVVVVFGCGGDRDKTKRKMMGQIAAHWADDVIVTDDNPRQEEAARIRAEILEGCAAACEISSRREAIAQAIRRLKAGDVCIIAGKGHEREQIVGDTVLPFNDADVVRELLKSQKENRREGETQRETQEGKKGKKAA